jgi:hypothetical protein
MPNYIWSKLFIVMILFVFGGCASVSVTSSKNVSAQVPAEVSENSSYSSILLKWERDVSLYKNLELYFSGNATLMVPEMLDAYKKHYQENQGKLAKLDSNIISEDVNNISVVVSMYTSSAKFVELDDAKIWSCSLLYNGSLYTPSSVSYYRNKSSFVPYFSIGSFWSRMYVLQFKVPHFEKSNLPIVFSMHSGIAKADFYWR